MNTNGILKSASIFALILSTLAAKAQPDYNFTTSSLKSGTALSVGAVYRFTSVKAGTDALVTIVKFSGTATLDSLDITSTGYPEAFQPLVRVQPHSTGYIEFNIQFVKAGTGSAQTQALVPATAIDIDGHLLPGDTLREFDQISLAGSGYYDYDTHTTDINVTSALPMIIGKNKAGTEYSGVDTTVITDMFTVVNTNVTSITIRSGADNLSGSTPSRYRSIYFKKFTYPFAQTLAAASLMEFKGNKANDKINLEWAIAKQNNIATVTLQKSASSQDFQPVADFWMNDEESTVAPAFHYADNASSSTIYYRLKLTSKDGHIEYSNILSFREANTVANAFRVFPTVMHGSATVNITLDRDKQAAFQLIDYSGRVVYQQQMQLSAGTNNISVNGFTQIPTGNYVAMVKTATAVYNQKVIVQN